MRINLFGGAGSGKSTMAAWGFAHMKQNDYSVELISEFIKEWAYLKRGVKSFDQVFLLGSQLHREDVVLYSGVKNLITDCPILLSPIYSKAFLDSPKVSEALKTLVDSFNDAYPCVNVFVKRNQKEYKQEGRFQSYQEAKALDEIILELLQQEKQPLEIIDYNDTEALSQIIKTYAE